MIDHHTIWENCLQTIRKQVNAQSFKTWFEPIQAVAINEKILTILVPNKFFYEWLEENYVSLLRNALRQELHELVGGKHVADLAIGDERVLEDHIEDRLDRLYTAKAYLQSEPELANSVAMEHVLDEIANEEIEVQRQRYDEADGEKGVIHG